MVKLLSNGAKRYIAEGQIVKIYKDDEKQFFLGNHDADYLEIEKVALIFL